MLSNINWIVVTIALNVVAYVSEFILDYRQSRKLNEATIPVKLAGYIDEDEFKQMKSYSLNRLGFSRLESTYGVISEIGILLCGMLVWARKLAYHVDIFLYAYMYPDAALPEATDEYFVIAQGVTFIFIVSLFSTIMKTPFEIYRIFVIDSQYQFGSRLLAYIMDQLKIFFISFFVGIPLLALILKLILMGSPVHWVYVWAGSAALVVGLFELYPNFLAPMFNSFRVLEDEKLRGMIEKLAQEVGFPPTEIVCMDGSTRSEHANAFLMGSGKNKKIVLYDNMLDLLSHEEIVAVLAHELGHYKFNHNIKSMLVQISSMAFYLFLLSQTMYSIEFYNSFGFEEFDPGVGLCLFSYLYQPLGNGVSAISNIFSRNFEYACDRYALELGHDMEQPLIQMHVNTIYNLVVDVHYSRYYNSHPSLMERIEKMEEWKKEHGWKPRKIDDQDRNMCSPNTLTPSNDDDDDDDDDRHINQYLTRSYHHHLKKTQ